MDEKTISFWGRARLAFRLLFNGELAWRVAPLLEEEVKAPVKTPEQTHASALFILSALQREGRFVDFVQQEVTGFSDEEIGAAARVVHTGCRKIMSQYLELAPAWDGAEGTAVTVPSGFDAQKVRLTGEIRGNPPFRGTLKHHGWLATAIRFPEVQASMDPRVLMPAEVEIG